MLTLVSQRRRRHLGPHSFPTRRSSDLGHADVRFSGYITVTAGSLEQLAEACAEIEHAAASCSRLPAVTDRKSTRLNSSHLGISYAVFCLKKKKHKTESSRAGTARDGER